MSVSIESLLADAKCLVGRLKDHDAAAAALSQRTGDLQKDIEARNTYQENLKEFNKVAGHQPRSTLVLGIQHENNAIRALQNENEELRQSLSEHQNALELIMSKYRHQMVQFTDNTKFLQVFPSKQSFSADEKHDLIKTQILMDKIYEMAAVMQTAAKMDEESAQAQQEYIARLEAENKGLRKLLLITDSSYGSQLLANDEEEDEECDTVCNEAADVDDSAQNSPTASKTLPLDTEQTNDPEPET